MKWSYTNGKLNVSSDETDQQFLLKELIEEASRHQAYQKKIISLFVILSLLLIISGLISSVTYVLMRKPPKQVRKLNRYFRD